MPRPPRAHAGGLPGLRRSGAVTELLFLFECLTTEPSKLRPIAQALGLTVQAASHSFRQLRARGFVEFRNGRYQATVDGVDWLHGALGALGDDVRARLDQLHVIRSTRALATEPLREGDRVSLELHDGLLTARRGDAGPSTGRVLSAAKAGVLVEVGELVGIVALTPAVVAVRTLAPRDVADPATGARLRAELASRPAGVLGAVGLEPYHLTRSATDRPVVRFGVAAASAEASDLGVPSTVVLLEGDLPRFLAGFTGRPSPPLDVRPLSGGTSRRAR